LSRLSSNYTNSPLILITGATGFVGLRLLKLLLKLKYEIRIISRRPLPNFESIICDLETDHIPAKVFDNVFTVFHLAGHTHDLRTISTFEKQYYAVNVNASVRLAKLAKQFGVKRFVYVSSVKAGGINVSDKCLTEEDQKEPDGIYGKTKREAELKILEIGRQSDMHVSIVRPSLVYGNGVKGNLALMHRGIEQGWFPPLPDTGNRRSMIHVDDLVKALLLVAKNDKANREIFIATDGVPHSSREIYEAVCHVVGKSVPAWSIPRFIFEGLALLNPRIRNKVDKLLGDEYYSSAKLEGLGFRADHTLKDWNAFD
jgi:UDP-glucose 4-epimerase